MRQERLVRWQPRAKAVILWSLLRQLGHFIAHNFLLDHESVRRQGLTLSLLLAGLDHSAFTTDRCDIGMDCALHSLANRHLAHGSAFNLSDEAGIDRPHDKAALPL